VIGERGAYVLFEGGDGSGKSTLAKRLAAALAAASKNTRLMAFPGRESVVGRLIRDVFEGKAKVVTEAMMWLLVAEAKDMEPQIRAHLDTGGWLVVDRHTQVSGRVYQVEADGHSRASVESVTRPADFRVPDRIYIIDVPADIALARRVARGETRNTLYEPEKLDRIEGLRRAYSALAEQFTTARVLDGTKTIDELLSIVWKDLGLRGEPVA
jgi:dTMP kinase